MVVNIPFARYRAMDRANASMLWRLLQSPLHARHETLNQKPETPQQALGTALHSLLLEGVLPPGCPKDRSQTVQRMCDSLLSKPTARVLFAAGKAEQTCLRKDPETGVALKCRFDWLPAGHRIVIDLKSSRNIDPESFSRSSERYGYYLQAAFYSWLYELEFGERPAFFFVVVENTPPHDSIIFEADESMIEAGKAAFRRALDLYAECKRKDFWPGMDWDWTEREHAIHKLYRPRWAK